MAQKYMVVVLGMEQREGPGAQEKADRLIARHKHRFHDMFATYHPPDIPGEVAGELIKCYEYDTPGKLFVSSRRYANIFFNSSTCRNVTFFR